MRRKRSRGFTLIELMVSLVVAGMIMTSLVAISSLMQRTMGSTKDITELQANLRFALRIMASDLSRVAFMYSADPVNDQCHIYGPAPAGSEAINYNGATHELVLRGNLTSSRDYLLQITEGTVNTGTILCRNQLSYTPGTPPTCGLGAFVDSDKQTYDLPFGDGRGFKEVFPVGQMFRMEAENGRYVYMTITANDGISGISFEMIGGGTLNRDLVRGNLHWINPFNAIKYQMTGAGNDWSLERVFLDPDGNPVATIPLASHLLDPDDASFPGLEVQVINDANGVICATRTQPSLQAPVVAAAIDPTQARALIITLRGRTPAEDPDFTIPDFAATDGAGNFGADLDGTPANGLARVRVEHTVIDMRNLGLNLSL